MEQNSLQALTWEARVLAGSCGLQVVEDSSAKTFSISQKGVLVMPVLTKDQHELSELAAGAILHEALHYSDSEFDALSGLTELERNILMVFEDYRIEALGIQRWAGAYGRLRATWARLYALGEVSRFVPGTDSLLVLACTYSLAKCRGDLLDLPEAEADASACLAEIEVLAGSTVVADLQAIHALRGAMKSTRDALELGRRVINLFVNPADLQEQPQLNLGLGSVEPGAEAPSDDDGQTNDMPKDPQGNVDDPAEPSSSTPGCQAETQPSNADASSDGNLSGAQPSSCDAPSGSGDAEANGGQATSSSAGSEASMSSGSACEADGGSPAISHASPGLARGDAVIRGDCGELVERAFTAALSRQRYAEADKQMKVVRSSDFSGAAELMRRARTSTIALQRRLQDLLQALTVEREYFSATGRVEAKRLWRVRTGNVRVFRRTEEALLGKTHVHVVLDASYSMNECNRIGVVREFGASLGLALETVRTVTSAISAFQGGDENRLLVIKRPEDRMHLACGRLEALSPFGGTPMAAAITSATRLMMKESADRRIMMLGTDGELHGQALAAARRAIASARIEGVEVIVFGIQTNASRVDADALNIWKLADLPSLLFARLKKSLQDQAALAA